MGEISRPRPVLRIVAAFSRHPEALSAGQAALEAEWGGIELVSDPFPQYETNYYDAEMGTQLHKQFWAFSSLVDSSELADWKILSNRLETELAAQGNWPEDRPLNLDPGYLTEAKLLLATTKDRDHRIYLRDGIFAEVTLRYQRKQWVPWPWTYPDYQRPEYHYFFDQCREYLRAALRM